MGHVVTAEKWIEAVLRHAPITRHLHITVNSSGGFIRLEGRVPTLEDRTRAGFLAQSVTPPGLGLDNRLRVEDDAAQASQLLILHQQDHRRPSSLFLAA